MSPDFTPERDHSTPTNPVGVPVDALGELAAPAAEHARAQCSHNHDTSGLIRNFTDLLQFFKQSTDHLSHGLEALKVVVQTPGQINRFPARAAATHFDSAAKALKIPYDYAQAGPPSSNIGFGIERVLPRLIQHYNFAKNIHAGVGGHEVDWLVKEECKKIIETSFFLECVQIPIKLALNELTQASKSQRESA